MLDAPVGSEPAESSQFTTLMLKAYAHPLRRRLLRELERTGGGRAADLARALGVAANAVSFHLRTLAEAGLIHEDSSLARDRRDRVWVRTLGGPANIGGPEADPDDAQLANAVALAVIGDAHHLLDRIARRVGQGELQGIDDDATVMTSMRHLTPVQFRAIMAAIGDVLNDESTGGSVTPVEGAKFYEIVVSVASDAI